jgi:hypothetical protein
VNDYIGSFRNGQRHGEGQSFYDDGVYEGDFERGKRSGRGVMYFKTGGLYIGEWRSDLYHGDGVLVEGFKVKSNLICSPFLIRKLTFAANGNRFEGSFANGSKHGEGIFFHCKSGQAQKGVWVSGDCKCSVMQDDEIRSRAEAPTPFPIPEVSRECVKSNFLGFNKNFFSSAAQACKPDAHCCRRVCKTSQHR